MVTYERLDAALHACTEADTPLDELAAMVALKKLAQEATDELARAALQNHLITEVARAIGVSRQFVSKKYAEDPTNPDPDNTETEVAA